MKKTNDSWLVEEAYIMVHRKWMYLYRAVDSEGNTIEFYLYKNKIQSAKRFFKKSLTSYYVT
ncbi:Transposase (plasmid) [Bacillus thuringiensis serovar indiana]|nr:Transposase [Bacillus thuringiensis serovar indiana]